MLAGLRPATTPIGDWLDASWAAYCEFVGPGEHIGDSWADVTGDEDARDAFRGSASSAGGDDVERRGNQAAVAAARGLSDEDRARWVPAYRRALELAEGDPDAADSVLEQLDRHWHHTAGFAGGQDALVSAYGDAARGAGRTAPSAPASDAAAPVVPRADPGTAFGMPEGLI